MVWIPESPTLHGTPTAADPRFEAARAEDGSVFAGSFQYEQLSGEYKVFFGRAGEQSPIQLGPGSTGGITPDGTSVFAALRTRDQDVLHLYPTGPGQARTIDLDGIVPFFSSGGGSVTVSRDGRRIALLGAEEGSGTRVWVLDLEGGPPRAVTPPGSHRAVLSPDGSRVAVHSRETGLSVYPVEGGDAQPVPGTRANEVVVAWSSDQRAIFVWDQTLPATVYRVDLANGRREPVRTIVPGDPAGILYGSLVMTTDARYYLLRFRRTPSQLYHVPAVQ